MYRTASHYEDFKKFPYRQVKTPDQSGMAGASGYAAHNLKLRAVDS